MSTKIPLVQGDNLPRISLILKDQVGAVMSLAGCTAATMYFKPKGSTAAPVAIPCDVDILSSKVSFEWADGVLNVEPGDYVGEVELLFGTKRHTVWDQLQFRVRAQFA